MYILKKYNLIFFGLFFISGMQPLMQAALPSSLQTLVTGDGDLHKHVAINCTAMATLWLAGRCSQESVNSKKVGGRKVTKPTQPSNPVKYACYAAQAAAFSAMAWNSFRSKEGLGSLLYAATIINGLYSTKYLWDKRDLILHDTRFMDIARQDRIGWNIGSALISGYLVTHYNDWLFEKSVG